MRKLYLLMLMLIFLLVFTDIVAYVIIADLQDQMQAKRNLHAEQWGELHKVFQESVVPLNKNDKWTNYTIISIDDGKTWYLINEQRHIIGNIDKIKPELKKMIIQ